MHISDFLRLCTSSQYTRLQLYKIKISKHLCTCTSLAGFCNLYRIFVLSDMASWTTNRKLFRDDQPLYPPVWVWLSKVGLSNDVRISWKRFQCLRMFSLHLTLVQCAILYPALQRPYNISRMQPHCSVQNLYCTIIISRPEGYKRWSYIQCSRQF